MTDAELLAGVKNSLGIPTSDTYHDNTLNAYIEAIVDFLEDAGVNSSYIDIGIVSRGVADLWNYGSGNGKLSDYFMQRATQLSYKS